MSFLTPLTHLYIGTFILTLTFPSAFGFKDAGETSALDLRSVSVLLSLVAAISNPSELALENDVAALYTEATSLILIPSESFPRLPSKVLNSIWNLPTVLIDTLFGSAAIAERNSTITSSRTSTSFLTSPPSTLEYVKILDSILS